MVRRLSAAIILISSWQYRVWASIVLFVLAYFTWAGHVGKDAIKAWWSGGKRR